MDYNGLICFTTTERICKLLFFINLISDLHNYNILKINFLNWLIIFWADKPNGFLDPLIVHCLSAILVVVLGELIASSWLIGRLYKLWMYLIATCDKKCILNLNLKTLCVFGKGIAVLRIKFLYRHIWSICRRLWIMAPDGYFRTPSDPKKGQIG